MGNESGEWIMHGMKWDNPNCIHSVDEAIKYINEFGFLPLFKNDIDGFSLEERTVPEYWWSDNPEIDPWMWRAIIARRHDIVYGKFFDKKAGFISKKWLPVFANYRRDGYDFDALYDDGKAPNKHKKIMVNFMEDNADSEIYSNELKKQAGFGKDGEKGFDGAITNLMMQTYLCNCDFKKRVNKRGIEYGWDVAVYSSIEHIYGYDYVTSCYKDNPQDSWKQIVDYMHEMYPEATDKQIRKKKTVMALCIALQLDLEQSRDLLARADWAFSPSSKVDLIVQKAIIDKQYDIMQLNVTLFKYTNEILGV